MTLPDFVRKRPYLAATATVASLALVSFPSWVATIWSLFSERPFAVVMTEKHWGWAVIGPAYGWLSVGFLLVAVAVTFVILGATLRRPIVASAAVGENGQNLAVSLRERFDQSVLVVTVQNDGPSDGFVADVFSVRPGHQIASPISLRWKASPGERREIVAGRSRDLEVLKVTYTKEDDVRPPEPRFNLSGVQALSVDGDVPLAPDWTIHKRVLQFILGLRITSASSGRSAEYELHVTILTDGSFSPRSVAVARPA